MPLSETARNLDASHVGDIQSEHQSMSSLEKQNDVKTAVFGLVSSRVPCVSSIHH